MHINFHIYSTWFSELFPHSEHMRLLFSFNRYLRKSEETQVLRRSGLQRGWTDIRRLREKTLPTDQCVSLIWHVLSLLGLLIDLRRSRASSKHAYIDCSLKDTMSKSTRASVWVGVDRWPGRSVNPTTFVFDHEICKFRDSRQSSLKETVNEQRYSAVRPTSESEWE